MHTPPGEGFHFGFVMEQTLGHITHYRNMRAAIDADSRVEAAWYPLAFPPRGAFETLPLIRRNWSARSSVRAWRTLSARNVSVTHDALLFHTQVPTLLCARLMACVPSVVSLDATPLNYDTVGASYGHRRGGRLAEAIKWALNRRALHAAEALITWCDWARQSLIADYGVEDERVTVIPPGVPVDRWVRPLPRDAGGPVRMLFVGADFARKGGEDLLRAFAGLRERAELHLVTRSDVPRMPGVRVYRDLMPNSDPLRRLYATADLFVLPSRADCFPLVVQEAMAAGLPVVATDVGAIGEAVRHGETGLLVPPGDPMALGAALSALARDAGRRRSMGERGRAVAVARFDSAANARRIVEIMITLAERRRGRYGAGRGARVRRSA